MSGKGYMTALAVLVLYVVRRRRVVPDQRQYA